MWKAIDLKKLNDLYLDYPKDKLSGETFSEFVEGRVINDSPIWDWVDSIGVVTPEDFENNFKHKFIQKNFEELANLWFNGLNGQIDFGIAGDCVKDEMESRNGNN